MTSNPADGTTLTPTERLAQLGLVLPPVVAPLASYVPARIEGRLLYTAGQLPMVDGALTETGAVGAGVEPERAYQLARVAALNGLAAAAQVAGGLDELAGVVKVTGFVACGADFTGHPAVVNGASELLVELFGEAGRHARSAVGVSSLPLGAPVEIELVLALRAPQ